FWHRAGHGAGLRLELVADGALRVAALAAVVPACRRDRAVADRTGGGAGSRAARRGGAAGGGDEERVMFAYYLDLALRSLKRNKLLTALMITYSVFRAVSGDPIPDKSAQLFTPQIDSWGPQQNLQGEPPYALNYVDAMALMRAHAAKQQTLIYPVELSVLPGGQRSLPIKADGYAVYGAFFPMFEVPFRYGSGWNATQDDDRAAMVVLSEEFNQKLFGGADSVGRGITLGGHQYRIAGV